MGEFLNQPFDLDLGNEFPFAIDDIDVQVYIATFWYNVQQFYESSAYSMAVLTAFSGLAQPILQVTEE